MPWGAAAVVAGAVISSQASKSAAKKGAKASEKAGQVVQSAANQARSDVQELFPSARNELFTGASGAFDIFNQSLGGQQQALQQGNVNAQTTLGGGFGQVQNALLGLPVDQSVFAPRTVDAPQQIANPFTDPTVANSFAQQQQQRETAQGVQESFSNRNRAEEATAGQARRDSDFSGNLQQIILDDNQSRTGRLASQQSISAAQSLRIAGIPHIDRNGKQWPDPTNKAQVRLAARQREKSDLTRASNFQQAPPRFQL